MAALPQQKVTLEDKYELEDGRVFLTGIQALVRLPMMQRQRDLAAGLDTGGFVSGYRGSPLGTLDMNLWRAQKYLERHHIEFEPGVNEDLAMTAVWGSQQLPLFPDAAKDGVFAMWYGKGPGVDRCGDVLKHGNAAGSSKYGGVLVCAGDDHGASSSTLPHQSDHMFMAAMVPILYPANVQEMLDYGLMGWAMSRYTGAWVAFKSVAEVVESAASVSVSPDRVRIDYPNAYAPPPDGLNIRWPDGIHEQEDRLLRHKAYAALAFARTNRIDRIIIDSPRPRLGIVTCGKSYLDVRQALQDLGIDDEKAAGIGIRLYKVGMIWPLEKDGVREFAEGLEEIVVVEEKRALIENQLKEQLYNRAESARPRVVGKFDEDGNWLLPAADELSPAAISRAIGERILKFHDDETVRSRLDFLDRKEKALAKKPVNFDRTPYFCSGCPHNSSTHVPEGSRAVSGIGCHFMSQWMDRNTATFTQMGGEGTPWISQAPFSTAGHIFANLGDGTYYHSGLLAIRACVAAGVNITYKILYNDAVAMTGGQPVEGQPTVADISLQVYAEGAKKVVVVSDEPDKYPTSMHFAPDVTFHHRDDLDRVQRDLREWKGVSVLIYDQTCAAEKRRRRKRGAFYDPPKRVFINERVCEGCGDCSDKSNCMSVTPVDTEFGRKRKIDQSNCNKDFSCIKGFCPSFVTVHGAAPRRAAAAVRPADLPDAAIPDPSIPDCSEPYGILVTGIGGTGVITIGALISMAAHIEGKGVTTLDHTGVAQKNGAVMSHIRIAERPEDIHAVRIAAGEANAVIGCDLVVTSSNDALGKMSKDKTRAIVNTQETMTAGFIRNKDLQFPSEALLDIVGQTVGEAQFEALEATAIATRLMGDSIATNMFMLGYALQKGMVPLHEASILEAIELNGVAVTANKRALDWGRRAAVDLDTVRKIAFPAAPLEFKPKQAETVDEIVAIRRRELTDYQNAAYADRYEALVRAAETAERDRAKSLSGFALSVARNLYKLMAYKDEYEVARLYSSGDFRRQVAQAFEDGNHRMTVHLAPPLLARRDPETGQLQKREYGPWIFTAFALLAKLRGLRGGFFDPFGKTAERRAERNLIADYEATVRELIEGLDADSHDLAVQIAGIPDDIRGYGHIKEASMTCAADRQAELMRLFRDPAERRRAAMQEAAE